MVPGAVPGPTQEVVQPLVSGMGYGGVPGGGVEIKPAGFIASSGCTSVYSR